MNLVAYILVLLIVLLVGVEVDCRRRRMVIDDVIRHKRGLLFREDWTVLNNVNRF